MTTETQPRSLTASPTAKRTKRDESAEEATGNERILPGDASFVQSAEEADQLHQMYLPHADLSAASHVPGMETYRKMYKQSLEEPEKFWGEIAEGFHWHRRWTRFHHHNYDVKKGKVEIGWFEGAETNLCYNALDRHVAAGHGDTVCFHWEGNDPADKKTVTYAEMLRLVSKFANVLKGRGVKKGDRVALYLPMVVELPIAMLACTRLGAIHSIVFAGFSAEALASRLLDAECDVLVTADGVFRGAKLIGLKAITDEALRLVKAKGHAVKHQVVVKRLGEELPAPVAWDPTVDCWWEELMAAAPEECPVEWVDAEEPLFMLYTSGSTGTPKGVLHSTAGYMVWCATTFKYTFDYRPGDVYFCTADIGWITGHSYITYGPMINRATSVMFEGVPTHPDAGRFWAICDTYAVKQFYTAPTAIRALMKFGDSHVTSKKLDSLRVLGTVGEPINPEAWHWYYDVVGKKRCSIVDTWWQTETGGHMLTPLPGATPMKPGSCCLPFFGVEPAVIDKDGKELEGECEGYLVMKRPWPGQMRTIYKNHQRFEDVYFGPYPGYYLPGDGVRRDADGYYWITGRIDDVLNVSGHRLGTAEVESSVVSHEAVVEAAVVGYPHDIKGEGLYCYVTLADGVDMTPELEKELKAQVRRDIGPFATPDIFHPADGLPKTRSGKIMRRILRKIARWEEDQLGDISTLADPSVVAAIIESRKPKVA